MMKSGQIAGSGDWPSPGWRVKLGVLVISGPCWQICLLDTSVLGSIRHKSLEGPLS